MRSPGTKGQLGTRDLTFRADGTIASGSAPQLVLPEQWERSFLFFQNLSASATMWLEFGSARAHATLSSGKVSALTVDNGGFGFTVPPVVEFFGGANGQNSAVIGTNDPFGPTVNHPAQAHAVLTAGVVTSIVIDDPGAGYLTAPYVRLINSNLDFIGCADPSVSSGSGIFLAAREKLSFQNTVCPTDAIAVFSSTKDAPFSCLYL